MNLDKSLFDHAEKIKEITARVEEGVKRGDIDTVKARTSTSIPSYEYFVITLLRLRSLIGKIHKKCRVHLFGSFLIDQVSLSNLKMIVNYTPLRI